MIQDETVEINFMLFMFDKYINILQEENCKTTLEPGLNDQTLLNIENDLIKKCNIINLKIIYSCTISKLLTTINSNQILVRYELVLDICKRVLNTILENDINFYETEDYDNHLSTTLESIQITLSLISVFTSGLFQLDKSQKKKLNDLIPLIQNLKNRFNNTEVCNMAESLIISIQTNCTLKYDNLFQDINEKNNEYERALNDIKNPLIPIVAHGLVSLRKLVDLKNKDCVENTDSLVEIVMNCLKHNDSYVYLAAINCLIR